MLVDSKGSRNPEDNPTAKQFLYQILSRFPVVKDKNRGSVMKGALFFFSKANAASSLQ